MSQVIPNIDAYIKKASEELQKKINYTFKNQSLIENVVLHPSIYKNTEYDKLEFLGDRVLGFIMVNILLKKFPKEKRNIIALRFTKLVSTEILYDISKDLKLSEILKNYASDSKKTEANNIEALMGAMYLDGDLYLVQTFVEKNWKKYLENEPNKDARGLLQEIAQKNNCAIPKYEELPNDNQNVFFYKVSIVEKNLEAFGQSIKKKDAATMAAINMLKIIGQQPILTI